MGNSKLHYVIASYITAHLWQQINDGGGCATMGERSERVESPGTNVTE